MELWEDISGFLDYEVSDLGNVANKRTGRILKLLENQHGTVNVGLMRRGVQCKRSVAVLVANAFLPYSHHELFDTIIHLNGDKRDNSAVNLDWRPLWFAQLYHAQFKTDYPNRLHFGIEVVETGEVYADSLECAKALGVIERDVVLAVLNPDLRVFPTDYKFREF